MRVDIFYGPKKTALTPNFDYNINNGISLTEIFQINYFF